MTDTRTILITGGIGSGKSVISRLLRLRGYTVYDTDRQARILMCQTPLVDEIRRRWGDECYLADGSLHREHVAAMIFGDEKCRRELNSLVHAAVRRDMDVQRDAHGRRLWFVECAIPVTSGVIDMVDDVWLVEAPEQLRIERVTARSGIPPRKVQSRIEAQRGEFEALRHDATLMVNDGSTALTLSVDNALRYLEQNT